MASAKFHKETICTNLRFLRNKGEGAFQRNLAHKNGSAMSLTKNSHKILLTKPPVLRNRGVRSFSRLPKLPQKIFRKRLSKPPFLRNEDVDNHFPGPSNRPSPKFHRKQALPKSLFFGNRSERTFPLHSTLTTEYPVNTVHSPHCRQRKGSTAAHRDSPAMTATALLHTRAESSTWFRAVQLSLTTPCGGVERHNQCGT